MTIRKLLFATVIVGCAFLPACDLFNKTSAQVSARKVIVGTVLHTPAFEVKQEAIAGLDANFPFFDGGFPPDASFPADSGFTFDAGIFFGGDGGGFSFTIPEQTVVFAYFGERNGEGLSQNAPTAVTGATMQTQRKTAGELALKDLGGGSFQLNSNDEKNLTYVEKADYLFIAKAGSETFTGIVEGAPALERIPIFHPKDKSFIAQAANTDLTFARPDPENGFEREIAFVLVIPINSEGKQGEPTYTNVPTSPLGFLKLALAPSEWKTTTVTIPGKAFPEKDRNYLILVQSAKLGRAESDNLFLGSAMIAGTADVGIVKTH
jgi:hypothetical protein